MVLMIYTVYAVKVVSLVCFLERCFVFVVADVRCRRDFRPWSERVFMFLAYLWGVKGMLEVFWSTVLLGVVCTNLRSRDDVLRSEKYTRGSRKSNEFTAQGEGSRFG